MKRILQNTYRTKLLVSFVITLGVPTLLGGGLALYWTARSVEHEVGLRLRETAHGLRTDISKQEERLLKIAANMSRDEQLSTVIRSGRRDEIIAALVRLHATGDIDFLEVGDSVGMVIGRGHNPRDFGEDKSGQTIIGSALSGRQAADIDRGSSGIGVRAVAPIFGIRDCDTRVLATVMVGDAVDSDFVAHYARITGVEIATFEDSRLIGATLLPLAHVFDSPLVRGRLESGGKSYDLFILPLDRRDGTRFGSIVTARERTEAEGYVANVAGAIGIALVFGFLVAGALVFGLVRLFSRPLEELKAAMHSVEEGLTTTLIPLTRTDEFGELEMQFNRMAEKLREASRKVERMQRERIRMVQRSLADRIVAEVAHEIRNPLNAMAAQIELLRTSEVAQRPDSARRIDVLSEEIRRLDRTVEDLVAKAGPIRLEISSVHPRDIIERLVSLLDGDIRKKNIRVDSRWSAGVPAVRWDKERIHQALLNILLNAVESMPRGGRLLIEVSWDFPHVCIAVSDTGTGMDPKELEEIFNTYYTTKKEGTGIGLSVALRIVEAHGGRIHVESKRDSGTTFCVTLPAHPESTA